MSLGSPSVLVRLCGGGDVVSHTWEGSPRSVINTFSRYKAVIDACCLQPDIDLLPFGDQTEIGERVGILPFCVF